jgi:hypothetical protein
LARARSRATKKAAKSSEGVSANAIFILSACAAPIAKDNAIGTAEAILTVFLKKFIFFFLPRRVKINHKVDFSFFLVVV